MDKIAKDQYFDAERTHWWFVVRALIIEDLVKRKIWQGETLKILNIGCGTGRTSEILEKFGTVKSVEYDHDLYEICKNKIQIDIIKGSITDLPFAENTFDMVCAFDVIEHVEDDQKAVNEMFRVCKPNGHLYILVPAFQSLWSEHDVLSHHFRRYKYKSLKRLFNNLGGQEIYTTYFNTLLFFPIYFIRIIKNKINLKSKHVIDKTDVDLFKNSRLNVIFELIFSFERKLLNFFTFPFGVSIALIWKKK